jgi:outer membrane murein-binding lipoprotein Lpp
MWSIFGAIGTMLLGLLATGVVALVKATISNTAEMKVLGAAIKDLTKVPAKVDKIKQDVDNIHEWKRNHEKKYP